MIFVIIMDGVSHSFSFDYLKKNVEEIKLLGIRQLSYGLDVTAC
jgi:hypothetical protein